MYLYVHRNLNRDCWSLLYRGRLLRYRRKLLLHDVEFRVRPGGARRARQQKKRNVHAFAIGRLGNGMAYGANDRVRYDIWKGKFIDRAGRNVVGARKAYFTENGQVYVEGPVFKVERTKNVHIRR